MSWHYEARQDDNGLWHICEVYEANDTRGEMWTGAMTPEGETLDELIEELVCMLGIALKTRRRKDEDNE